jgi:hypothetical protein
MIGSTLMRGATLLTTLAATPLALAQEPSVMPEHWPFVALMAGLGMLFVIGIVIVALWHDRAVRRERLALVERLVTAGNPVPPALLTDGPTPLPLAQERRRDARRGITLLCWAIAIAVVFYFASGGQLRTVGWGLLPLILSLGSFLKAWLTSREIARGADADSR